MFLLAGFILGALTPSIMHWISDVQSEKYRKILDKAGQDHLDWSKKHQKVNHVESVFPGGNYLGMTKQQLDEQFDKLPGQNDKA
jgi:hypothetical protein